MLAFLPKLVVLLSCSNALLPRMTAVTLIAADQPPIAPRDPSTLGLAIVGFVTLVVYVAATGWRRSRSANEPMSRPRGSASTQEQSNERLDKPTRGAA